LRETPALTLAPERGSAESTSRNKLALVVGTARCAVQRRVQRRNASPLIITTRFSFRPLIRGRAHRSAMSQPVHALRLGLRPQPRSY